MFFAIVVVLLTISLGRAAYLEERQATATAKSDSAQVPDYFQTSPELFAGELPLTPSFLALLKTVCPS